MIRALRDVGLDPETRFRYPHEFSGGQRQRIALARAVVLEPTFVVLDEPTSALDMLIQAQMVDLLRDLQKRLNLTYLFISHDLRVVAALASRLMVMRHGKVVEEGPAGELFANPKSDYTRALFAAAFNSKPRPRAWSRNRIVARATSYGGEGNCSACMNTGAPIGRCPRSCSPSSAGTQRAGISSSARSRRSTTSGCGRRPRQSGRRPYACVWRPPHGMLAGLPNLKAVFSLGAGVDDFLTDPKLPNVPIMRIVDADLTMRMTEYVVLHVLTYHRQQRLYDAQQRVRMWRDHEQPAANEVAVGIMGLGVLGIAAAMALQRLGFRVCGLEPHARSRCPGSRASTAASGWSRSCAAPKSWSACCRRRRRRAASSTSICSGG